MSEIFRWLKKTELERKRVIPEPAGPAVELADNNRTPDFQEGASNLPDGNGHSAGMAIRTDAKFDLSGANAAIKMVLDPLTDVGEHYRMLRARLSMIQKERGIKTLLVTSTVPSEGKTFTACCLAGVFAQEPGKRVLLVSADLRRPNAARNLGLVGTSEMPGLAQVLRGEAAPQDVMLSSNDLNFYLMPAGAAPPDPAELLSSPLLEQTLTPLREGFDWIVLDSPPVLALADASLLAPLCDAVLLVVRTDSTPVNLIKEAIARLGREKVCGIVMNRGRHREKSNYYYYRYYRKNTQG